VRRLAGCEILPGGYTSIVVNPGFSCFRAGWRWEYSYDWASAVEILSKEQLNLQPGHSAVLRLERGNLFTPSFVLRWINTEAARPEIGKCRQTLPLSTAEILGLSNGHGAFQDAVRRAAKRSGRL
jgi:hypothetical protein